MTSSYFSFMLASYYPYPHNFISIDTSENDIQKTTEDISDSSDDNATPDSTLLYYVDDVPPWYLCILLGFQQFLTASGGIIAMPILVHTSLCMGGDYLGLSELIGTMIFCCGLATIIQTAVGIRLPIIQGATSAFYMPIATLMSQPEWKCPYDIDTGNNSSDLPPIGSEGHRAIWYSRIQVVAGSITVASTFQVFLGLTGLIGFLLRFIGPLTVCCTTSLIGLSLTHVATQYAAQHWYIALSVILLLALFSQFLANIAVPCPGYKKRSGFFSFKMKFFQLFPVLLTIAVGWLICFILTKTESLPNRKDEWGYRARTDTKLTVFDNAPWFKFPYPLQWGTPTVSVAGVCGMLAGVIASVLESIGDYYACARLSGSQPPPTHAINRGVAVEGLGCFICGFWGAGNGTTSYSQNIAAISITKVGSRRVVLIGGVVMIILSVIGKFTAIFVAIPDPVFGGIFFVTLGMVTAVGLSNLQFVDMSSSRNLFIIGTSLFSGLAIPSWIKNNSSHINTGYPIVDQIICVLLGTNMFVSGMIACIFDNTIPGSPEERGMLKWNNVEKDVKWNSRTSQTTYDLPLVQKYINKLKWTKYIPICPTFHLKRHCKSEEP